MENVPENELFSAYLDGELTADEQAQVEKLLAASPAARQLLDELRALSTTLQGLPAHKLGEDIGGLVLRQAERQMLREPAADLSSPQPAQTGWRSLARRFLAPRTLVWSGTAVAVAILLSINNPEAERLAMAPDVAEKSVQEGSGSEEPAVGPSMRAVSDVADEVAPMEEDIAVDSLKARSVESKSGSSPGAPAMSKAAPGPARKSGKTPPAFGAVAGGSRASGMGSADGSAMNAMKKKLAPAKSFDPKLAKKAHTQMSTARDDNRSNGRAGGVGGAGGALPKGGIFHPGQAIEGVLVVRCDISPKAVRDQAFDRVLGSQKISLNQTVVEAKGQLKEQQRQIEANLQVDSRQSAGELDLIYAEATLGQIEGTLATLSARPDTFLSVSIEPDPSVPSQQPLMRYGRGRSLVAESSAGARPAVRPGRLSAGKPEAAASKSQPVGTAKQGDVQRGFAQRLRMPAQAPGEPMQSRPSVQAQSAMQPAMRAMQSAAPSNLAAEAEAPADKPTKAEGRPEAKPQEVRADGTPAATRLGMARRKSDSGSDIRQQIQHFQAAMGPGQGRAGTCRVLFVLRVVGSPLVGSQRPAVTNQASEATKAKATPSVDASQSEPAVKP